jgi:hypothetical protein
MSLLDVQNFLARIYTDAQLRRRFGDAPKQIGRENNLTETESAELAAVLPFEIDFFADSLLHKRRREVEKLLPFTKRALSEAFEKHFREFSGQFLSASIKKHLDDAIGFAKFLQTKKNVSVCAKDLAKFEQAKLEFNACDRRFIFKIFDYDVKNISCRNAGTPGEIRRKKTFAVWFRIGKRTRHYIW